MVQFKGQAVECIPYKNSNYNIRSLFQTQAILEDKAVVVYERLDHCNLRVHSRNATLTVERGHFQRRHQRWRKNGGNIVGRHFIGFGTRGNPVEFFLLVFL